MSRGPRAPGEELPGTGVGAGRAPVPAPTRGAAKPGAGAADPSPRRTGPRAEPPADRVFRQTRRVEARHTDELGHVNNLVWVRFAVELAWAHSVAAGLDYPDYVARGGIFVIRRHEIDYRGEAREGEELLGETWVEAMRGARAIRRIRFLRAADGAVLLETRSEWAFVDIATHRPRRIPAEILQRFTAARAAEPRRPGSGRARDGSS